MYRRLLLAALLLPVTAQAQWTNVGPGRFDNAAFVSDGATTYARVWAGSVARPAQVFYRSDDGGRSWNEIARAGMALTTRNTFANSAVAMDARDGLLAVLTSDNAGSRSTINVYTSTDGGTTWKKSARSFGYQEAEHLVVVDGTTLVTYFRINNQNAVPVIFVSTDAGTTWSAQTVASAPFVGQFTANLIHTAGGALFVPQGTHTLVSRDNGATWTLTARTADATASSAYWTEGSRYYAHFASGKTTRDASLHWTDDGGQTWSQKALDLSSGNYGTGFTNSLRSKGDTLVYATPASTVGPPGIRYSFDFGDGFQEGDADSVVARAGSGLTAGTRNVVHATTQGLLYAPLQQTGARIYFSSDGGVTWTPTNARGFEEDTPPVQMLPGGVLLAPLANREGYYRSTDRGETWRYLAAIGAAGFGGCFNDDGLMTTLGGAVYAYCRTDTWRSTDGLTWTRTGQAGPQGQGGMDYFFANGAALYTLDLRSSSGQGGTRGTLRRSTDDGATWVDLATDLSLQSEPAAVGDHIVLADLVTFGFAGARVSTDGGATFADAPLQLSGRVGAAAAPGALFVSGGAPGSIFADATAYLYRSTDGGVTWANLAGDGTALGLRPIPSVHYADGALVALQADTVSVSSDLGDTWTRIGGFAPLAYSAQRSSRALRDGDDLFVQVIGANQVYSGLWRASLSTAGVVLAANADAPLHALDLAAWPSPTRGDVQVRFTLDQAQLAEVAVYDVLGRRLATLAEGVLPSDTQTLTWQSDGMAAGLYFVRLTTAEGHVETRSIVRL